jgi:hypothetical protein
VLLSVDLERLRGPHKAQEQEALKVSVESVLSVESVGRRKRVRTVLLVLELISPSILPVLSN